MIVSIHQPNFIPWTGYFNKMNNSDIFVLFDDVQFPRAKTFGNRVQIKTNNGPIWITVPVLDKGDLNNFNQVRIDHSQNWINKTLKTIKLAYQKAPYFKDYWDDFELLYTRKSELLIEFNVAFIEFITNKLEIKTKLILSSDIKESALLHGEEKILSILKELKATEYLSGKGAGSMRYINEADFHSAQIKLLWQVYEPKVYKQQGNDFIPNLSIIDLLFNEGSNGLTFIK